MSDTNIAIVSLEPMTDTRIAELAGEAEKLYEYANKFLIQSPNDMTRVGDDLGAISVVKKELTTRKRDFLIPLKQHQELIIQKFDNIFRPLLEADTILRKKFMDYNAKQEELRQEAAKAARLAAELEASQQRITEQTGEVFEPVPEVEIVGAPVPVTHGGLGALHTTQITKWELEDFTKLPEEYKIPDSAKIGKVVRAGASIPGIRTWKEAIVSVKTKKGGGAEQEEIPEYNPGPDEDLPF